MELAGVPDIDPAQAITDIKGGVKLRRMGASSPGLCVSLFFIQIESGGKE